MLYMCVCMYIFLYIYAVEALMRNKCEIMGIYKYIFIHTNVFMFRFIYKYIMIHINICVGSRGCYAQQVRDNGQIRGG
jgi:hypothetical protein